MILCLDVGNTHIYGGVFNNQQLIVTFRYPSKPVFTSDILGLFLKQLLEQHNITPKKISDIVICSVVPALDYSIQSACKKYFNLKPLLLTAESSTGLVLDIDTPSELGADRIATALAATDHYPGKNIIIVDFGTATTLCAVNKAKHYIGGAILPGFKLSMESLSQNAAQLSAVDIDTPTTAIGKCTKSQLQAGIYYSQLGAIQTISQQIITNAFANQQPVIISTGGYGQLLQSQQLFNTHIPDLVLHGLRLFWQQHQ